jgi:hypothetical protein
MQWAILLLALPVSAATWREELDRLRSCASSFPEGWRILDRSNRLATGLDGAWLNGRPKTPVAPEYIAALGAAVSACEKGKAPAVNAIADDLDLKIEDCVKFGMARLVPVEIVTKRGANLEEGWEVTYEWEAGRKMGAAPVRLPGLTPGKASLPPGIYLFRAKRGETATPEVRVPVARTDKVTCEIPIP